MVNPFSRKYRTFKEMLRDADKVIWDIEFKKYTALNEHELVRRQYDQGADALNRINIQLKADIPAEQKAKVEEEKKTVEKTVTDLKAYMDNIMGTIVGTQPTEAIPEGTVGLDQKLRNWVERREYIKGFIKHNC